MEVLAGLLGHYALWHSDGRHDGSFWIPHTYAGIRSEVANSWERYGACWRCHTLPSSSRPLSVCVCVCVCVCLCVCVQVKAEALFGTLVAHPTHHYVFSLAAAGKQMLVKVGAMSCHMGEPCAAHHDCFAQASTANAARDWLSSIKQARSNAVGLVRATR